MWKKRQADDIIILTNHLNQKCRQWFLWRYINGLPYKSNGIEESISLLYATPYQSDVESLCSGHNEPVMHRYKISLL